METVRYHMNDVIEKHQNKPKDPVQTVKKKKSSYRSTFLRSSQQTPHKTAEVLYKQILWYFQRHNSFSEHQKNQVFFPYKDKLAPSFRSKVVYRANCWDCNDFYIGKTKRRLRDRKTEHFKALTTNCHESAIADHVFLTNHCNHRI